MTYLQSLAFDRIETLNMEVLNLVKTCNYNDKQECRQCNDDIFRKMVEQKSLIEALKIEERCNR